MGKGIVMPMRDSMNFIWK